MLTKKIISVVLCAFLFSGFSFSQQRPEKAPQPSPPPTKEMKLEHLSKKLQLNDQQVEKVENILNNSGEKIEKIREKYGKIHKEMMEKIKLVMDNENQEIEKNLDEH